MYFGHRIPDRLTVGMGISMPNELGHAGTTGGPLSLKNGSQGDRDVAEYIRVIRFSTTSPWCIPKARYFLGVIKG